MKSFSRLVCSLAAMSFLSAGLGSQETAFVPVTQDMLNDPEPGQWLHWRGTQNAWGYSPLDQITTANVGQLQLVWAWAMDDTGPQEAAPLIHNGVMYLPNPGAVVQALDAATGDLLWEYRPEPVGDGSGAFGRGVQKNIAIFGDRIFGASPAATIFALDARSGKLIWETTTADTSLGYRYTAGPIVANGKHLPLRFRAGSDAWIAGSYDPELKIVYWATSQAKPWARSVRGTDGDALYTNSSLALDPDTGELLWYYQYLPGETHDMDEVFETLLIDVDGRKKLYKMGKLGILWQLDRETGEFLDAIDIGYQNLVDVDRETGEVTYRPELIPEIGVEINMCPSTSGFKGWRAMSYDPNTGALYIPVTMNCELATFGPVERVLGGGGAGPVKRINTMHPYSGGNLGELLVIDVREGDIMWRHRTESPINTAALATGGGVVFAGDYDRYVYAYEARTGEILWQTRLPTSAQGFPVSYLAGGRQYVAIPVGTGGASWAGMVPRDLIPHIRRPSNGNSIHVFALPAELPAAAGGATRLAKADREAAAVAATATVWDGVYTAEQAERGAVAYRETCATCHGEDLGGGSNSPGLVGVSFQFLWGDKTLHELYEAIRTTMPTDNPASLPRETYRDILAYMMQVNEFPPGDEELDAEGLGNVLITDRPDAR